VPLATFLQVSDLHLGSPFGWLPAELRERRRRELQRVLEEAVLQAIMRRANAILVAGDLFDSDGVDPETLAFAVHAFDRPGCPPVFIAPGNHDPWSESSLTWSPRVLRARNWAWPAHVHIFTTAGWSSRPVPSAHVRIWGRCFTPGMPSAERPLEAGSLSEIASADPAGLRIALFHGSREGHCPPGQKSTAPFSDDEIRAAPFAYLAVGHYHRPSHIEEDGADAPSRGVRLAYAGSAAALAPTEIGSHGALEVRIEQDGSGHRVETQFVPLDPRQVHELQVELNGITQADQVDRRIRQALDEAGISDQDIVTVRLHGRLVKGVRYGGPGPELQGRAFTIRTDLRGVRPDYDLESYRHEAPRTTEERFVKTLLDRLESETDPEQRALIEGALYYGLDAFRLREVVPAYEELEA